jgi:hypothetical protein
MRTEGEDKHDLLLFVVHLLRGLYCTVLLAKQRNILERLSLDRQRQYDHEWLSAA